MMRTWCAPGVLATPVGETWGSGDLEGRGVLSDPAVFAVAEADCRQPGIRAGDLAQGAPMCRVQLQRYPSR